MQCSAIVASLVCLLVELFQLNARIAADPTPLIQGDIAPFEWAGKFLALNVVYGWGFGMLHVTMLSLDMQCYEL